ncbi:MAG TPA: hypothetical protein VGQ75_00705, partial [Thermoanaerobaculia bacterium]|nr:hypothetical protein [Thermoanaerobaculia bacterium]
MAARMLRASLAVSFVAVSTFAQPSEKLAALHMSFVENTGQIDPAVAFYASTAAGTTFVTHDGRIVYSLPDDRGRGWTLTESFSGGRPRPHPGEGAITRVSYFHGSDPRRWRGSLPTYESVDLGQVWRGVSVSLRVRGRSVEK